MLFDAVVDAVTLALLRCYAVTLLLMLFIDDIGLLSEEVIFDERSVCDLRT